MSAHGHASMPRRSGRREIEQMFFQRTNKSLRVSFRSPANKR